MIVLYFMRTMRNQGYNIIENKVVAAYVKNKNNYSSSKSSTKNNGFRTNS